MAELSRGLVETGALIRALAPETATLEDLFFSLTEGPTRTRSGETSPHLAVTAAA